MSMTSEEVITLMYNLAVATEGAELEIGHNGTLSLWLVVTTEQLHVGSLS
jgi:hypothetical protein